MAAACLVICLSAWLAGSPRPAAAATKDSSAAIELQAALDRAGDAEPIAVIARLQRSAAPEAFRKVPYWDGGESPARVARVRQRTRAALVRDLRTQAELRGNDLVQMLEAAGATNVQLIWSANAVALRAPRGVIWQLLADSRILDVRLDAVRQAPIGISAQAAAAEWNIDALRASELWDAGIEGQGIVIASLDSGVDDQHPDLASAYRGGNNSWYDPYGQHATPADLLGHGTQVMGLMVGGSAGGTAIGVSPQSQWIAAKIFDDSGRALESAILLAFDWLLDPDGDPATDDAPDVVVNAWDIADENTCSSVFADAIAALKAADISVVFSAGNYGPAAATSVSPANLTGIMSVGSVDRSGAVSGFSSRGPSACDGTIFPKVVAPGEDLRTADFSAGGNPVYANVTGTSYSAPQVAAVSALLRSGRPTATAGEVEAAIAATARDVGVPGPDNDSGYGFVDAVSALDAIAKPIDDDNDGFPLQTDCNDQDASIHPGAPEARRDGIDQDCNGFDLTIDVKYAVYSHDGKSLNVRVTSALGPDANLEIVDVGSMTWRESRRDWVYQASAGAVQDVLTIRGPEGEVQDRPRQPTRRR
ncbi:MAG: S8 family serine peptidase [Steroidobacteraceae bacterium]